MTSTDELGALIPTNQMKKKPSFYGIRSHLSKFYELSFSSDASEQSSPSALFDPKQPQQPNCASNKLVKGICRLCIFSGSISILVGVCLLIAVFSSPVENPILSPANSTVERVDLVKLRHNSQVEGLQTIGVYMLLSGSVMLLLSTIIAIVYLIAISCRTSAADANARRPYVYEGGDY